MAQIPQSQQCSRCGLIVVVGQQVGSCYGGRLHRFSPIPAEGVGINLRADMSDEDYDRLAQAALAAQTAPRIGADTITVELCSSVDTATAASPSQTGTWQTYTGMDSDRHWEHESTRCKEPGGCYRCKGARTAEVDSEAEQRQRAKLGAMAGTAQIVSGGPCPNCRALGPHTCKLSRHERAIEELIGTTADQQKQIDALRVRLATERVAIGSDVSAAAAPSSPKLWEGGGWVSCADRLPDPGRTVLAYLRQGRVTIAKRSSVWAIWLEDDRVQLDKVTHWMSLPASPAI